MSVIDEFVLELEDVYIPEKVLSAYSRVAVSRNVSAIISATKTAISVTLDTVGSPAVITEYPRSQSWIETSMEL